MAEYRLTFDIDRRVTAILEGGKRVAVVDLPESKTQQRLAAAGHAIAEAGKEIAASFYRAHENMKARSENDVASVRRTRHLSATDHAWLRSHAGLPEKSPISLIDTAAKYRDLAVRETEVVMRSIQLVRALASAGRTIDDIVLHSGEKEANVRRFLGLRDSKDGQSSAWHVAGETTRMLEEMNAQRVAEGKDRL